MRMRKVLSSLLACSIVAAAIPVFAQIPETVVPTIDNAAVVVQEGVNAHQSMRIEGDVYAGEGVKFDNATHDYLDGDIIAPKAVDYQDEYSAILNTETNRKGVDKVESDMGQYLDQYFSGQYLVDNSTKPVAPSYAGVNFKKESNSWFSVNGWSGFPVDGNGYAYYTISQSTEFESLNVQGAKLVIDASAGPIYVKVNQSLSTSSANNANNVNVAGYIEIKGDNPVYLIAPPAGDIFLNVVPVGNPADKKFDFANGNVTWIVTDGGWSSAIGSTDTNAKVAANIFSETGKDSITFNAPIRGDIVTNAKNVTFGNTSTLDGDIYSYGTGTFSFDGKIVGDIVTKATKVELKNSGQYNDDRITGNINAINAKEYSVGCQMRGNTVTSAETFVITGGANTEYVANIKGTVYAPKADVKIHATSDNGIRRGQLIAKSLDIFGEGAVIWGHAKNPDDEVTPAPAEPTEEPVVTPEPTLEPLPSDEPIELSGGYAYIFGDEPVDLEGHQTDWVNMAPDRKVSREEVSAMIMRMIDQEYDTTGLKYELSEKVAIYSGLWYARGLAYMDSKNAFEGMNPVWLGPVSRGEVAKLIVLGLNLDAEKAVDTGMADVADNMYKTYINIVYGYGYMNGRGDGTFGAADYMTRAEFCVLFNNIIGRTGMGLTTADGTEVTAETYSIMDLGDSADWIVDAMLKATSAYDNAGNVDLELRQHNIRNILDNYSGQTER
ncbi:MAG: S-layer homology domain-containing protein [Oscillospiraceae bacterium]|nr:S-layer homology domain-containing protein [Oscillospiraceae bacterium]